MKSCKYFTPTAESMSSFDNLDISPNINIEMPLQGQSNCSCPSIVSQTPSKVAICPFNTNSQPDCSFYEANPSTLLRVAVDKITSTSNDTATFVCLSLTRGKFGFLRYEVHSGRYSSQDGITDLVLLVSASKNSLLESFDEETEIDSCLGVPPKFQEQNVDDYKEVISLYNHFCEAVGCTSKETYPKLLEKLSEVFMQSPDKFIDKLLNETVEAPC